MLAAGEPEDGARLVRDAAAVVLEPAIGDRVAGDGHRLPDRELLLAHGAVGTRTRDADREQHDRRVDDVTAVASTVVGDQLEERAGCARSAHELDHDRGQHEGRERVGDQARTRGARACCDQGGAGEERDAKRPAQRLQQCTHRSSAPGRTRATPP